MNKKEEKNWIAHEPSTYSYLGRNDSCVNWILTLRKQQGFHPPKILVLIGSGAIEPFTIAALPLALKSQIIAVEINPALVNLGQEIKSGEAISWPNIAKKTQHPGVLNTQLTDPIKLNLGIEKLESLGSLTNLGPGFNNEFFQVEKSVTERVSYIHADALSALKSLDNIEAICDFFVQVNINKNLKQGIDYTKRMVASIIGVLSPDGYYILGDSGRNMSITLDHIDKVSNAKLKVSALTHVVNQDGKYSSSYYSILGKDSQSIADQQIMEQNITNISDKYDLPVKKQVVTVGQLARLVHSHVYFGFIKNENNNDGTVWYSPLSQEEALVKLTPSKNKAFTDKIIFPK